MPNTGAKPPKKRKALSRKIKGGNKKRTSYDYKAAREALALPKANHAQILQRASIQQATNAGETLPTQKSPLKSEYKAMLKKKTVEAETLHSQNAELKSTLCNQDKKLSAQQEKINQLASLLRDEKKKSRAVIVQLMEDADSVIAEASDIRLESDAKVASAFDTLEKTKQTKKDDIHKERQYYSNHVASCELLRYYPYR